MKEFENKVALVTGGSSGIGRVTAIAFARDRPLADSSAIIHSQFKPSAIAL